MSSQEDERNEPGYLEDKAASGILNIGSKKRRLQRACDICRRRKVRCDGGKISSNQCTNCKTGNLQCTYVESSVKRSPSKPLAETLDTKLTKMERLISNAMAGGDFGTDDLLKLDKGSSNGKSTSGSCSLLFLSPEDAPEVNDNDLSGSDDEAAAVQLVHDFQKLSVDTTLHRFFGKSSGAALMTAAMDAKSKCVNQAESGEVSGVNRPEYWTAQPWVREKIQAAKSDYIFPDDNLLWNLIDCYFTYVNTLFPLLHRPTFEEHVADDFHKRDGGFGGTLSLVCALGARFSDDPRVLLEGSNSPQSAGWAWYDQVQLVRNYGLSPANIYEIQSYCLAGGYLMGCSSPQACWNIVGIGLRLIQDVGAHRKKVYKNNLTISDELWKRAFWCLIAYDRFNSVAVGRAPALNDEDFDVDLPSEVDDEYWTNPDQQNTFTQPAGKPSVVVFFIAFLKLHQIAAFALRTIYSINRSKVLLGYIGPRWQQDIVAQLDSALNKWVDNIPTHLRWDPYRENPLFFDQSAILYAFYYQTQILVHRPFIPKPGKPPPLSFPSLAICTNAARSCSHVCDVQRKRNSNVLYMTPMPAFTSGIVLLLGIWGATKSGMRIDRAKEMEDVYKCTQVLLACETRCHFAGRFQDILRDLGEAGKLPLPEQVPLPRKRNRGSDVPLGLSPPTSAAPDLNSWRPRAGSHRVSDANTSGSGSANTSPSPKTFPRAFGSAGLLPMHSSDLGKLPVHHGIKNPPVATLYDNVWSPGGSPSQPPSSFQTPPSLSTSSSISLINEDSSPSINGTASLMNDQFGGVMDSSAGMEPSYSCVVPQPFGLQSYASVQPLHQQPEHSPSMFMLRHADVANSSSLELLNGLFQQPLQTQQGQNYDRNVETCSLDTLQVWSNAPTGFEWGDWCEYIDNVNNIGHVQGISSTTEFDLIASGSR